MIRYLSIVGLLSVSLVACATSEPEAESVESVDTVEMERSSELEAFKEISKGRCIRTGCSGQVCASSVVYTTCEWRPEYACYADATCERQEDGNCGWTMTPELEACLGGLL